MHNTPLILSGVFFLGLIIGSFLNVVILRFPRMLEERWRCQCEELLADQRAAEQGASIAGDLAAEELHAGKAPSVTTDTEGKQEPPLSLSYPPSTCPKCDHRIRAWENIPVLSYLLLRGRCAGCRTRIPLRYPAVELATGLSFVAVIWVLGPTPMGLAGLWFTALLIAMSGIDYDHQLLPEELTHTLFWSGLLLSVPILVPSIFATLLNLELTVVQSTVLPLTPTDSILGAVLGYGFLWSVYWIWKILFKKEAMGYGDFWLLGALGAWMGWQLIIPILLIASLAGAIIGLTLMGLNKERRGKPIPFGPFLAVAGWIVFLWPQKITGFLSIAANVLT